MCAIQVRELTEKSDTGYWECRLTRTDKHGRTRKFSTTYNLDVGKGTLERVPKPTPRPPTRRPNLVAVAFDPNDPEDKRRELRKFN